MGKKWITDLAMAVLLLLLMAYSLVGEVLHEWMGIAMLALFVLHHIWNRAWYKSIGRGRPSPYRAVQTVLNLLLFAAVLGMIFSGLILSQHILDFLPLRRGETIARTLHLPPCLLGVSAYEPAPGPTLERHYEYGPPMLTYAGCVQTSGAAPAAASCGACGLWPLCVYPLPVY